MLRGLCAEPTPQTFLTLDFRVWASLCRTCEYADNPFMMNKFCAVLDSVYQQMITDVRNETSLFYRIQCVVLQSMGNGGHLQIIYKIWQNYGVPVIAQETAPLSPIHVGKAGGFVILYIVRDFVTNLYDRLHSCLLYNKRTTMGSPWAQHAAQTTGSTGESRASARTLH